MNIVIDLDCTLGIETPCINSQVANSLQDLHMRGYGIIATSEKHIDVMCQLLPMSHFPDSTYIACNGAVAYKSGVAVYAQQIDNHHFRSVLQLIQMKGIPYLVETPVGIHFSKTSSPIFKMFSSEIVHDSLEETMNSGVVRIQCFTTDINISEHIIDFNALCNDLNLKINLHKNYSLSITEGTVDKFLTYKALKGGESYICFGKGIKDYSLFKHSAISINMGTRLDIPPEVSSPVIQKSSDSGPGIYFLDKLRALSEVRFM